MGTNSKPVRVTFSFKDDPPSIIAASRKVEFCPHCGSGLKRVGLVGADMKRFAADIGETIQSVFECPNCHVDIWVFPRSMNFFKKGAK